MALDLIFNRQVSSSIDGYSTTQYTSNVPSISNTTSTIHYNGRNNKNDQPVSENLEEMITKLNNLTINIKEKKETSHRNFQKEILNNDRHKSYTPIGIKRKERQDDRRNKSKNRIVKEDNKVRLKRDNQSIFEISNKNKGNNYDDNVYTFKNKVFYADVSEINNKDNPKYKFMQQEFNSSLNKNWLNRPFMYDCRPFLNKKNDPLTEDYLNTISRGGIFKAHMLNIASNSMSTTSVLGANKVNLPGGQQIISNNNNNNNSINNDMFEEGMNTKDTNIDKDEVYRQNFQKKMKIYSL